MAPNKKAPQAAQEKTTPSRLSVIVKAQKKVLEEDLSDAKIILEPKSRAYYFAKPNLPPPGPILHTDADKIAAVKYNAEKLISSPMRMAWVGNGSNRILKRALLTVTYESAPRNVKRSWRDRYTREEKRAMDRPKKMWTLRFEREDDEESDKEEEKVRRQKSVDHSYSKSKAIEEALEKDYTEEEIDKLLYPPSSEDEEKNEEEEKMEEESVELENSESEPEESGNEEEKMEEEQSEAETEPEEDKKKEEDDEEKDKDGEKEKDEKLKKLYENCQLRKMYEETDIQDLLCRDSEEEEEYEEPQLIMAEEEKPEREETAGTSQNADPAGEEVRKEEDKIFLPGNFPTGPALHSIIQMLEEMEEEMEKQKEEEDRQATGEPKTEEEEEEESSNATRIKVCQYLATHFLLSYEKSKSFTHYDLGEKYMTEYLELTRGKIK